MIVKRVIPSGYCKGVVNAINIVKKAREDYKDKKIYVLGMIVHNSFVIESLTKLDIITLDDSNKTKEELLNEINEGVVVFTAHGVADSIKQKAKDKGLITIDATCIDVLKIENIIKEYLNKGYDVIYFGKKNHPEVEAILSLSNNIHLIENENDISKLEIHNDKILVTNQTTISYIELKDLTKLIIEKFPNAVLQKEICNATSSRQLAVSSISDGDILYVVGDKKSNNTNKLKEIGEHNFKKVFLINNAKEIIKNDLIGQNNIYVTAGASTPPTLIDEVINQLELFATELSK